MKLFNFDNLGRELTGKEDVILLTQELDTFKFIGQYISSVFFVYKIVKL